MQMKRESQDTPYVPQTASLCQPGLIHADEGFNRRGPTQEWQRMGKACWAGNCSAHCTWELRGATWKWGPHPLSHSSGSS